MAARRMPVYLSSVLSRRGYVCSSCIAQKKLAVPPRRASRQYASKARPAPSTDDKEYTDFLLTHHQDELKQQKNREGQRIESAGLEARLTLAYSSGYLEKAPSYLLEQIELLEDGQKSAFNGLSEDVKMSPDEMARVAKVVARSSDAEDRRLGALLMRIAFEDGGVDATIHLAVNSYLKEGRTWGKMSASVKAKVLKSLTVYALRDSHPEAMNVLGQIYQLQGRDNDALDLFISAMSRIKKIDDGEIDEAPNAPNLFSTQDVDAVLPVWIILGNEHLKRRNRAAAAEAYEEGAIRADDPYAYICAARVLRTTEGIYSPKWVHYVTKAAASGHPAAAMMLGDFYEAGRTAKKPIVGEDRKAAGESMPPLVRQFLKLIQVNEVWGVDYKYKHLDPYYMKPKVRDSLAECWFLIAANYGVRRAFVAMAKIRARQERWDSVDNLLNWAMYSEPGRYGGDSIYAGKHKDDDEAISQAVELLERYRSKGYI